MDIECSLEDLPVGMNGKRELGKSILSAWFDDDEIILVFIYI